MHGFLRGKYMDIENENTISGFVEDIIYQNAENGYSVLDLSVNGKLITAVGMMAAVTAGEELTMSGEWVTHPTFGLQFKVKAFERKLPKSAADMLRYLSAGTIKGIGPATAMKIVERFGDETFDVLENSPQELSCIKGISEDKAQSIGESFKKQFAVREIMIYLEKYGMSPTECLAAYRAFGSNAAERIRENPYILCRECVGMSFDRADAVAEAMDTESNPIFRLRAGVVHIVRHNLRNGHTCLPRERVIAPACELLSCTAQPGSGGYRRPFSR